MARTYRLVIGTGEAGARLDRQLAQHVPSSVSRAMIQRGIREGLVTVGGRPVKAHYKLRRGDVIAARFDQLPSPSRGMMMTAQEIPLEIQYEDAELLVVNKPAGLVTHPAPGHWDGTLVNAILWHLESAQGSGLRAQGKGSQPPAPSPERPLVRAGIVHRLDKDTSGLLLVAKTEAAHAALSRQLKARTMRRRYLAFVEGHLPLDAGTINAPIGRHLTHRKVMTVRHLGGRSALTHYRVLKRFGETGLGPPAFLYTLVEVSLETGRTHQIRVHMAHLGHPVLGDLVYGRRPMAYWQAMGIGRQLLHAYAIRFVHPTTRTPVTLKSRIPEDMSRWLGGYDIDAI